MNTYVDEAIMEEEAEDGSSHPWLVVYGLSHGRQDDAFQVGAFFLIERRRQLPGDG